MSIFYNQDGKKVLCLTTQTPNFKGKHQAVERRRGKKKTPLGIKITFPGFDLQATSYNLRNSFSPELFWVLSKKTGPNVPVGLYCSLGKEKPESFCAFKEEAHQALFLDLL